jgi:methionine biosynthesis protein MetW
MSAIQDFHSSPDDHGAGLLSAPLDPFRYEGSYDPVEASALLNELMPDHVRVLDVGCGTGSVTSIANAQKNNVVIGIEPDEKRAAVARERGIHVICGFLDQDFINEHGTFDVVVFADVLEHMASPDQILSLALKALKPGGLLLVSVPNVAHWSVRLKLLFGRFDYAAMGICDSTHLRWFTKATLTTFLQQSGRQIIASRAAPGLGLGYYKRLFKLLPKPFLRKLIIALTKQFPTLFACQFVMAVRVPR